MGNDHIARQYTQSKKVQWLKKTMMLAQLQEIGIQLSKEKLVILANTGERVDSGQVPYSDSSPNDMINQDVQEMQYSEQTHIDDFQDNEIHSDSNIILYSQYLQESQDAVIQDTNSAASNDLLVLSWLNK
nr:hypothetical protein [Tanacetum cinerariifolium]